MSLYCLNCYFTIPVDSRGFQMLLPFSLYSGLSVRVLTEYYFVAKNSVFTEESWKPPFYTELWKE
jgi:hypothetical protein